MTERSTAVDFISLQEFHDRLSGRLADAQSLVQTLTSDLVDRNPKLGTFTDANITTDAYWTRWRDQVARANRLLNAVIAPVAPASTGNIYEFRNYRTRPGAAKQWLDLFTGSLKVREKYSKIVGLWATDAGQPNEVCHIWAYSDLNARAAARAASAKDPGWQEFMKSSTGLLDEMHSTIMLPAAHSPLK